ncbi:hypothetical protein N0V90_013213 [Kalmusia sp. IMI 367209]|nr:hypothetical protein N0V90_013213 [Kalmusia sp. IMI 367209]
MPAAVAPTTKAPNGTVNGCKPAKRTISRASVPLTYPSQALQFLEILDRDNSPSSDARLSSTEAAPARLKLNIVIVGAGLGGKLYRPFTLRSGRTNNHKVGAGIQIPPNSGRLLHRWGIFEHLQRSAVQPEAINFRRWEDGKVIGHTALGGAFEESYKVPYYVAHRAHFHEALHQRALQLGVFIELGCKVVKYNERQGSVELQNGGMRRGDLVVAADDDDHEPVFNGFAAYRATVDVKKMIDDPEINWILEKPTLNIWIGADRHVMSYTIAAGESFNMVLSHVDHSDPATWTQRFAKEDVEAEFAGWDPKLTKIISLIDECMKWPLKVGRPLKSWISRSSKLLLLGDAAHAMLPYMSQGAAMAVEDGAALAVVLNQISSLEELPFALQCFEEERIKRSGDMQNASTVNGYIWHFPDGPEQKARDAAMAAEVVGKHFTSSANQWSDPVTQWWAYGYDAEEQMEEAWSRNIARLIARVEGGVKL